MSSGAKPRADLLITRRKLGRLRLATHVQVGARFALLRHAVDGARHLAIDEDDALVTFRHLGPVLLHHERLAEHGLEQLHQRGGVGVVLRDAEDGGTPVAVERLQDHVLHLSAERLHVGKRAGDDGGRHQVEKIEDEDLFRRIAHVRGVVDDERLGVNALEQMRRRDVGHVEGRILAQQHHVAVRQILGARLRHLVVGADLVDDLKRLAARQQAVAMQGEVGRGVVEEVVAPFLRLQQDRERGIAADVDPLDRVHLTGNAQGHWDLG